MIVAFIQSSYVVFPLFTSQDCRTTPPRTPSLVDFAHPPRLHNHTYYFGTNAKGARIKQVNTALVVSQPAQYVRFWTCNGLNYEGPLLCLFVQAAVVMAFKRSLAALGAFTLATIVVAENEPIPQPECDATKTVSVRHSGTTKRLYLEGVGGERGGCITLSQIYEARVGKPPIFPVDPLTGARTINATGTWLLTEDLFVEDGITLNVSLVSCLEHVYGIGFNRLF